MIFKRLAKLKGCTAAVLLTGLLILTGGFRPDITVSPASAVGYCS